jgi:predicted dehydrogenase
LKRDHADKLDVPLERQFAGFDAFQNVLDCDIDLVILATPPGFRPQHFEAAIAAGKHVFMEKPVAVDPAGVRRVLATTAEAKQKNLAVAVGLQRHHERRYLETIKRLHDGAIGDIVCTRVYWNGGGVWVRDRKEGQTEMEYQLRNWYYFNWLCGDHITEQHIHNLDVGNWVKHDYPVRANAQGGREVRKGKDHGQIFDHHFVEFTYGDGSKMFSQCRHIQNCWNNVSEHAHGTNGSCNISGARIYDATDHETWNFGQGGGGGHQEEHHDLFAALRRGEVPNEGEYGAMSTMTSVLGRLASYSGKMITMEDAMASQLIESPVDQFTSFDQTPPVVPDEHGNYPVPVPGQTEVLKLPSDEAAAKAAVRQLLRNVRV